MKKNIYKAIIASSFIFIAFFSFQTDSNAGSPMAGCGCDPQCNSYCKCGSFESMDYHYTSGIEVK